ncbi:MAG: phage holin family protein [Luteitalea sp.]
MDAPRSERTIGELFSDLSQKTTLLIRQEVQLAKSELSQKAAHFGRGAAIAAVGGAVVHAALLSLVATVVLLLVRFGLDAWAAAGLTTVLLAGGGYLIVRSGLQAIKTQPVAPVETMDSLKETAQWLKNETR